MSNYYYKAKDRAGNTVTGTVDALNERQAAEMIREKGCLPMDIRGAVAERQRPISKEAGSAFSRHLIYPLWTGVNLRALAIFYRQMATLLQAGMSVAEALGSAGSRTGGRLGRIIAEMQDRVRAGGQISESMDRYPRVFSPLQRALVRAGERGGLIQVMFDRIAGYLEYELSVRRRIIKMLFYPCVIFFMIVVMPHVPTLVLTGGMAFLRELSDSVRMWLPWAIGVIVAAKLLLQFEASRYVWDIVKIQPPVIGTMARKIAMSRFSRAFAVLYAAGVSTAEAIHVSADACANVAVSRGIKHAIPGIEAGEGLTASLARTRMIMPMVLDMLTVGERSGSMDGVLEKVADYMDEEVDVTIDKTNILLFVLMILLAGGLVLMMAMHFYVGAAVNEMKQAGQ